MRSIRVKAVWLAAAVAAVGLLAAGCSGAAKPGAGSSPGGLTVQTMDSFAACMRGHGVAGFYFSARGSTPSSGGNGAVLSFPAGYTVTGVNGQTAQYQSAIKACRHIIEQDLQLPPVAGQEKQLEELVKAAACMRSHGYPGYADPSLAPDPLFGGQAIFNPGPPAGVDTSSPQYLKAAKACGGV
jgi:hypothetical protein